MTYEEIQLKRMVDYCFSFMHIRHKRTPFINIASYVSPMLELVHTFLINNVSKDYESMKQKDLFIYKEIYYDETRAYYALSIIEYLYSNPKFEKGMIYELMHYVMNNFKPNYKYEKQIYTIYPNAKRYINKYFSIQNIIHKRFITGDEFLKEFFKRFTNKPSYFDYDAPPLKITINNHKHIDENVLRVAFIITLVNSY